MVCDLQPGDFVWVCDPDAFNLWRQMVEITAVGPTGWARARPVGGQDIRGPEEIRWWPPDSLVYLVRTLEESGLTRRCRR